MTMEASIPRLARMGARTLETHGLGSVEDHVFDGQDDDTDHTSSLELGILSDLSDENLNAVAESAPCVTPIGSGDTATVSVAQNGVSSAHFHRSSTKY